MRWPWRRRSTGTTEPELLLAEIEKREVLVDALASQLDRALQHNHFSVLVQMVIDQVARDNQ